MNKKIIRKIVVLFAFIMLISITTNVKAQYEASLELKSNSVLVESGDVTVTTSLQAINLGSGVDTIVMKLDYDKSVFEKITQNNMNAGKNWILRYAESTNMLTLTRNGKTTKTEDVLTINFKVKSVIITDSTVVKFEEIDMAGLNAQNTSDSVSIKQEEASIQISRNGGSLIQTSKNEDANVIGTLENEITTPDNIKNNIIIYVIIITVVVAVVVLIVLGFILNKNGFKNKI